MPTKTSTKKKTTKKASKKYTAPSASKKMLFINIGVAAIAVVGYMGYSVFHNMGTADAATTTTTGQ